MAKKRFAGGWEFDVWDETVAYDQYDIVYHEGYLYKAVVATSAGDNPLTAEATFTFTDSTYTNTAPGDPADIVYLELPKWVLWDLGADYYYGLLKGRPTSPFDNPGRNATQGVRTLVVRANFSGSASDSTDEHSYDNATQASYSGYEFPSGMTSDWEGGLYAPSMVEFEGAMGTPTSYFGDFGNLSGLIYQPTAFLPVQSKATYVENGVTKFYASIYWDNGGISTSFTIGSLFALNYSRDTLVNGGDYSVSGWTDNWTNAPGTGEYAPVNDMTPDPATN